MKVKHWPKTTADICYFIIFSVQSCIVGVEFQTKIEKWFLPVTE